MNSESAKEHQSLSYADAGVDINKADAMKQQMANTINSGDKRVLNTFGAFASHFSFHFPDMEEPILVTKMEEPGSKQLLAAQHGRLAAVGFDLVNHLINDLIVTGAQPLAIQDTIVCGELESDVVLALVDAISEACKAQGCVLVGGETSEQPRVIPSGAYILSAAAFGVVDRKNIIDGSTIAPGDVVIAVASNGVHTNGYTLIRSLLEQDPGLAEKKVGEQTFLEAVLLPHLCYNALLQDAFQAQARENYGLRGLAHITGGGVVDNLRRILPANTSATVNLEKLRILPVFHAIREAGNVPAPDMLRTFNLGAGLAVVLTPQGSERFLELARKHTVDAYPIGEIEAGDGTVTTRGQLPFA